MAGQRIDKWLWFARFCKSRSLAQHWVEEGQVRCNGRIVEKASNPVSPGDLIVVPSGRTERMVLVLDAGWRRGPPTEARLLYRTLSDEETEMPPGLLWTPPDGTDQTP